MSFLSEFIELNPPTFTTLYKNGKGDTWHQAYSGLSESAACSEADKRKEQGVYAVRVVDGKNNVLYTG